MIRRAHAQTAHGACEESPKNEHIAPLDAMLPALEHVQEDADEEEEEAAEEVGVDVDGFIVQVEQALQALGEGVGGGGPVVRGDVGVVAAPGGEGGVGEEEGARGRGGGEEFAS